MAMAEKFNTGQEVCLQIPSARGVMQVKEDTSGSIPDDCRHGSGAKSIPQPRGRPSKAARHRTAPVRDSLARSPQATTERTP
jgi:hypothetical protein